MDAGNAGGWVLGVSVLAKEVIAFIKWWRELDRKTDNEAAAEKIAATLTTIETTVSAAAKELTERIADLDDRLKAVEKWEDERHEAAVALWRQEVQRLNKVIYAEATDARDREGDLRVANAELAVAAVEQLKRSTDAIELMLRNLERCHACDSRPGSTAGPDTHA